MIIEQPPVGMDKENVTYITRMWNNVSSAINNINNVAIVTIRPGRPKIGKIYYIDDGVNDAGYYVIINDEWKKLSYES